MFFDLFMLMFLYFFICLFVCLYIFIAFYSFICLYVYSSPIIIYFHRFLFIYIQEGFQVFNIYLYIKIPTTKIAATNNQSSNLIEP